MTAAAVVQGLAIGVLVSLLFSVVPLLEVRNVKPSLLLRQDVPSTAAVRLAQVGRHRRPSAASLVGVAAWQAGSLRVGLVLSAGFVAIAFVLHLAGLVLMRAVQPLRYARSFALRQAVLHVARPGNQTRVILLAVGLGSVLHPRRPRAAGEPAARLRAADRARTRRTCSSSTSSRRSARA